MRLLGGGGPELRFEDRQELRWMAGKAGRGGIPAQRGICQNLRGECVGHSGSCKSSRREKDRKVERAEARALAGASQESHLGVVTCSVTT